VLSWQFLPSGLRLDSHGQVASSHYDSIIRVGALRGFEHSRRSPHILAKVGFFGSLFAPKSFLKTRKS
jgi:hypothetical protein